LDIEVYISSGVLELYATGHLSASEQAEVESLARQYPEIGTELTAITDTLDHYASLYAQAPPAALKGQVLAFVHKAGSGAPPGRPEAAVLPLVPPTQRAASDMFKWLVAASVVLLLASNALSVYFYRNWKRSENSLELAVAAQQQYAQNIRRVQQQLSQKEVALALMSDPGTRKVELKGVNKSPDSRVTVYWHQPSRNVYLAVNTLPAPPTGRQYQLWALAGGKPIDAGVLDIKLAAATLQQMKDIGQAQAFAITLEPAGGSASPTLNQMYVMGNI
jgi:anti-sigma-K factor RskA